MLKIKRAYQQPEENDGVRILVDRIWPRGMTKEQEQIDLWAKEIAPSTQLRKQFGHKAENFSAFTQQYKHELANNQHFEDFFVKVQEALKTGKNVTFVFGAKDEVHNQAVVLRDYILSRL